MVERLSLDEVKQIDCNNPAVDYCMATRFGDHDSSLVTTEAGKNFLADHRDNVPYGCPLTQDPEKHEREPEDFTSVCQDCSHSFIS